MMDRIILRDLVFFAHHGVLPVESQLGQNFSVTIELELPLAAAGRSDRLEDTVDYLAVREVVRGVIEGERRQLLETLAETIASGILRDFAKVAAVTVEVTKPRPPVEFRLSGISIRIRRDRAAISA